MTPRRFLLALAAALLMSLAATAPLARRADRVVPQKRSGFVLRRPDTTAGASSLATLSFFAGDRKATSSSSTTSGSAATKNVFFIKLSSVNTTLDPDELCGVESALRVYGRDHRVYLLTTDDFDLEALRRLKSDTGAPVLIVRWQEYVEAWRAAGTLPHMLRWYDQGHWRDGYVLNNLSNAFRLILLYNHGGAYFDLDIVHIRAPRFRGDFLTWQKPGQLLNNAALRLSPGHPFLYQATAEFAAHFNGKRWGHNGPNRLSQAYNESCPAAQWCGKVLMMPARVYYPVPYKQREVLYVRDLEGKASFGDQTFGVHLWKATAMSGNTSVVERDSPFHLLAKTHCPSNLDQYGLYGLLLTRNTRVQAPPAALTNPTGRH